MQISLRAGNKLYVNGAVIRVDRKVNIELLNDVTFLMEAHVLQAENADTPLKQLYFVIQTLLIDPKSATAVKPVMAEMFASLARSFENREILEGLRGVEAQVASARHFEALKGLRALYPIEAAIITQPVLAMNAA